MPSSSAGSDRRKYARLRKAGRVSQHTTAERRHAAAERERHRAADQRREVRLRRATLPVAAMVSGAAASVVFGAAPATGGIAHLYRPFSAATQLYPWVPSDSEYPDYPHVPEAAGTFSPNFDAAGTARTHIVIGPVGRASRNPWEAYGPTIFGD